jgi:hypothetical protein
VNPRNHQLQEEEKEEGKRGTPRNRRKRHTHLLCCLPQPLHSQLILAQINALLLLELANQVVEDGVVKVLATQEGVSVGGLHLEDTTHNLQDGHIKGACTQSKQHNM